jgi:AbrB family looped-hinge helix DNA binding protein
MATATMTSKGQLTVPISIRKALKLEAGARVEFVEIENNKFAIVPVNKTIQSLKGILRKPAQPVSIEDMNQAIARHGALAK